MLMPVSATLAIWDAHYHAKSNYYTMAKIVIIYIVYNSIIKIYSILLIVKYFSNL